MGMADGYAQATGRPAAVNVHVQPGLANAMSGILNAARCRVPLLVTVGQQVQSLLPEEPFLGGELVELAPPARQGRLGGRPPGRTCPRRFARAVRTPRPPPCGPVVLTPPARRPGGAGPAAARAGRASPPRRRRPPPRSTAPPPCLGAARAPAVLAGDAVAHAGASAALARAGRAPRRADLRGADGAPRCRSPPTTPSGAARCRRSRPRSPRCWRRTTWCSPSGCRCSGSSAPARARPCRRARRSSTWRSTPTRSARSTRPRSGLVGDVGAGSAGLLARLGPGAGRESRRGAPSPWPAAGGAAGRPAARLARGGRGRGA